MDWDFRSDHNPQYSIEGVKFRFYTTDEVRALSVKEITNVETFDTLGHPNMGGLHDPSLGPSDKFEYCSTCGLSTLNCPGHMGHIELALPLFNPVMFPTMYQLVNATCFNCHRIFVDKLPVKLFLAQCSLLRKGFVAEAMVLQTSYADTEKVAAEGEKLVEIDEYVKQTLATADAKKSQSLSGPLVKNVDAVRLEIVKCFIKTHVRHKTKCIFCSAKIPNIRKEYHSKIYVNELKTVSSTRKDAEEDDAENGDDTGEPKSKKQKVNSKSKKTEVTLLTPLKIKEHLQKVWNNDTDLLRQLYPCFDSSCLEYPTDLLFVEVVPVPATKFRPISFLRGQKYENTQTSNLLRVLKMNYLVREILWELEKSSAQTGTVVKASYSVDVMQARGKTLIDKLSNAIERLQTFTNCVVDSDLDKLSQDSNPGIKQLIEKKEGLFRKHMMGKRVNFAARSVISPDPNINTSEIGIPEVFAKTLSYPQPVTPWNVHEMRQAVINGPNVYPGATHVIDEDGHMTRLNVNEADKREALAKQLLTPSTSKKGNLSGCKKVLRHLKNGDILLVNRQPTLHKPSIQAHTARVLKGEKTLRLHYANCKAYNADFDGDEMNAHFPQNEIARSEAYNIACTDFQYLVPKDGTPLAGLIQDHMVSGVSLTVRGRFFTKDDYCRLVYGALGDKSGHIKLLPPSIIKPVKLWSGKQVLSTVVLNVIPDDKEPLSLNGKAKVPEKIWVKVQRYKAKCLPFDHMLESDNVIIRQGELLCGVLDKGHYGPTNYGLIHSCYELYGGKVAGLMLTCFGRLFTNFLQWRGFTLGVEDILVTHKGNKKRKKIIKRSTDCGENTVRKALELDMFCSKEDVDSAMKAAHFNTDEYQMRELDVNMRNQTNEIQNDIVNACMPHNLEKLFPDNNLQLMVQSGAKGSMVNCMQISCLLGQIELEGKRPPLMLSGKTLPSFLSYDVTPRAGGFVTGRFLTGIRQQEYFFHCMAGREGLIDTAVKTSRSGYLQRCLIKHLEGIKVNYDLTVRDGDSSVIQFHYGEDSLDICKTGFLVAKQFPFLIENNRILKKKAGMPMYEDNEQAITELEHSIRKWCKKHGNPCKKVRRSGFLEFCQRIDEVNDDDDEMTKLEGRSGRDLKLCKMWRNLSEKQRKKYSAKQKKCPDPVLSRFLPYNNKVLPEKLSEIIRNYCKSQSQKESFSEEQFTELMNRKLQQSVIEPGEAVGLLCAQSIGEPSTQMTLNTFHFAGRGEMNVTLGIPRLREILMVGSKEIKTPALDVPVLPGSTAKEKVRKLQVKLTKVRFYEVLKDIEVCEWLSIEGKFSTQRRRVFRIKFSFLPEECYSQRFMVRPNGILNFVEKVYIKKLVRLIRSKISSKAKSRLLSAEIQKRVMQTMETEEMSSNRKRNIVDDDDDDDENDDMEADDGDNTATSQKRKKMEEHEYEDEDEVNDEEKMNEDNEENGDDEEEAIDEDLPETEDINEELIEEYGDATDSYKSRVNFVLQLDPDVDHYTYDKERQLWCEVTISFPLLDSKIDLLATIQDDIKRHIVHEVTGISRCILSEEDGPSGREIHLKTEGINMHEVYNYTDVLDINRLYCNSIHEVAVTYGIEAASRVIIKEIQSVFAAYGIDVAYRHLSLLADYMTFEGSYKPFNRIAMDTNPSPLQKMSFEQTMKFLVDSSITCHSDDLKSPSAQIVLGKNVMCGTGCLDLYAPFKTLLK